VTRHAGPPFDGREGGGSSVLPITVRAASFLLRADKAIVRAAEATLFVADVHLGKAARFRRLGVPVPEASTVETLDRLSRALAATGSRRLVVLGDLLHGPGCVTADVDAAWAAFRERHPSLDVMLVRGNHDARAGDPPRHWRVESVSAGLVQDGVVLLHEPPGDEAVRRGVGSREGDGLPWLAGHVHPALVLHGRVGDRVRLPCFQVRADGIVLPAFGAFTGMHAVRAGPGERLVAVMPDRLWEVASPARTEERRPRAPAGSLDALRTLS
jgi:uncharacterized protein